LEFGKNLFSFNSALAFFIRWFLNLTNQVKTMETNPVLKELKKMERKACKG
jgi:hypothetical protein